MDTAGPESHLRSVIADGLARLDAAHGGRYLSEVARQLGVERSTVSRWRNGQSTAQPAHCDGLARRWPEHFDREQFVDLQFRAAQGMATQAELTVGIDVLDDPGAILQATADALRKEPVRAADRVYRHVAFHLDRNGDDPIESDLHYQRTAGPHMLAFRSAMVERAAQGWDVRVVVSAGNPARYESIAALVESVDGPAVEVFAYPMRLPLVVAPVMIANRDVILTHDHRRYERPGAAMMMRSSAVARWAGRYVDALAADAPFRLRDPAGIDRQGLSDFRDTLC